MKVVYKRKIQRQIAKLPQTVQERFERLVLDLRKFGPALTDWPNYSKLGTNKYHCHLTYRYVACWTVVNDEITIEVYYVGSRENAPY